MFRSEEMVLSEIIFAQESMWETMNYLAHSEKVMFTHKDKPRKINTENTLQNFASNMVKRCEELEQYIMFMDETFSTFGYDQQEMNEEIKHYIAKIDDFRKKESLEGTQLFETIEGELQKKYESLFAHVENRRRLLEKTVADLERMDAVKLSEEMIPVDFASRESSFEETDEKKLKAFYGLLPTENLQIFQKMLFRMTRGNTFFKFNNLDLRSSLNEEELVDCVIKPKSLIFILTPSGEDNPLYDKINRMLINSGFENLDIPYNSRRDEMRLGIEQEVHDNREILNRTNNEIKDILNTLDLDKRVKGMGFVALCKLIIARELNFSRKLIYLEKNENLFSLMIWVPAKYFAYLKDQLEDIRSNDEGFTRPKLIKHELKEVSSLLDKKVPTFFDGSPLTFPFQEMVDTYGVPRYKEANPALFSIISFPFFFGLMYGDVGHGSIILVVGILLLIHGTDPSSHMYRIKWMIMLMGIFATYCGVIYGEFFANPLPLFSSCYNIDSPTYEKTSPDCVYPFGLDYIWYLSANEISFLNSFKMKFSIIIGVIQMLFGSLLKGSNAIYFGKWEDLIFEAIPQLLFMGATFGYMSFCIIYKWLINWDGRDAPSIIQLFINFMGVEQPLYGDGTLQQTLQTIFVVICGISFFLMILPKPIVLYMRQKNEAKKGTRLDNIDDDVESKNALFSKFIFLL